MRLAGPIHAVSSGHRARNESGQGITSAPFLWSRYVIESRTFSSGDCFSRRLQDARANPLYGGSQMANTTFNGPVRSENGFEQISVAAGTGTVTTNLDIDSSGNITTTGYVSGYDNVVSITDDTYSVASTQSGAVFTLNRAAGIVVTLPTAAAGLQYTFIVGTTFTGAGKINTQNTSDLYSGFAMLFDPATATDMNTFIPDASDDDTIDLGSAEQGWLVGGVIRLKATTAAVWHCEAFLHGDGTLATPFE